jgi:hypothetical protein
MKWDLDHLVPLRDGGTSRDTHPSHAYCNRSHGGRLAHGEADPGVGVPPPRPEVGRVNSRDWFTTPTDPTGTVDKA